MHDEEDEDLRRGSGDEERDVMFHGNMSSRSGPCVAMHSLHAR